MRTAFKTVEVAELLREYLKSRSLDNLAGGNESVKRAVHAVLHEGREWTELSRVDLLLTAMGRPDLLQLLTER